MSFFEKNRNVIFWALQLLGWFSLNIVSVSLLKDLSKEFVVYSIVTGTFIGVFATSILRWYIKRNILFDGFSFQDFIKILVSVIMASIIFGLSSFGLGYIYGKIGPEMSELELKILKVFDSWGLIIFSSFFNVILWLSCYLVVKLLLRFNANRIERLELNAHLKQAQLNTLKGQINPHFMFNSLNNIRGLMLEDVERSREMLTKLSEMLRYSLTKNNVEAIVLEEELEMVDNFIALSKIQLEDRLQFEKHIGENTLQLQIPPMIIQLLVENAVKHGISNLKEGGRITLMTKRDEESLLLQVNNSGVLKLSKDSTRLGINNIQQRLKLLYGAKASFTLEELNGEVVAQIKIPLP